MPLPRPKKLRFLIASGPTQEPLDPVRFISNYSTGIMGKYLVESAKKRGHSVEWVKCPDKAKTALDLQKKLSSLLHRNDVLIMAAAVADVRPASPSSSKIKKENLKSVSFVKNPDILAGLSKKKEKRTGVHRLWDRIAGHFEKRRQKNETKRP